MALATLKHAHADSPYLMQAHARLGLCLVALGQRTEASKHWQLAARRAQLAPKLNPAMLREVTQLEEDLKAPLP
jgi:hypothetical protein